MEYFSMPLFSVVIPTLNRAHRLKNALASVMAQEYADFDVTVSDNCSTDDTKVVIASFADERVHYVRPDSYLRIHDHWEFARKHAKGEYLIVLADDDCLTKNALSELAQVIKEQSPAMVGCNHVHYCTSDYWDSTYKNHILTRQFTYQIHKIPGRLALSECFRFNIHPFYYPRVTVPVARALVESIAARAGRFYDYPYPEFVGMTMAYATIDNYPFLDKPLVVLGRTPDSFGPRYFWSSQDTSWNEFKGKPFVFPPLKGTYMTNGVAESFLRAKNYLPIDFKDITLSWVDYYRNYYTDMLVQKRMGRNVETDMDDFYQVVETLPAPLKKQIKLAIHEVDLRLPLFHKVLRKLRRLGGQVFDHGVGDTDTKNRDAVSDQWIDGNAVGVSDIGSCVRWLETQIAQ
jgi:glycosyltransferase involved in cell wall biosynthesis